MWVHFRGNEVPLCRCGSDSEKKEKTASEKENLYDDYCGTDSLSFFMRLQCSK